MFPSQGTISWTQLSLPRAASRATLCISSFLEHIAWIGTKVYPLLHLSEALQNNNINLVILFPSLHQDVRIDVPFRSSRNECNQILNYHAMKRNELYKLNKSNLTGYRQVFLRELQYYLHCIIRCYNSVT